MSYFSVLKIEVVEGDWRELDLSENDFSGVLVQYPDTDGHVSDFSSLITKARESKVCMPTLGLFTLAKYWRLEAGYCKHLVISD